MISYAPLAISLLVGLGLIFLFTTVRWLLSTRHPKNFPPGPPTLLGPGNLHQVPQFWSWDKVDSWAKTYGPIMGLKLGPRNVAVLNDASLVYELLVKRANSFSDRTPMWLAQQHVVPEGQHSYGLFQRNDYGQRLRALSKHLLTGTGPSILAPLQKAAAMRLVYKLFESGGEEWLEDIKPWGVTTPIAMISGVSLKDVTDDFGISWIDKYYESQQLWFEMLNPTLPAFLCPPLRWIPSMFAEWKRKAPIARNALLHVWGSLIFEGKKSFNSKSSSFSSLALVPRLLSESADPLNPRLLENSTTTRAEEDINISVFMGGIFDGSIGSTLMSFQTLILGLAAHPDVQRQAQAEIDAVFGSEGVPELINLDELPYLQALANEGQRWRPPGSFIIGPFGLPRQSVVDEEVNGYTLPKGTAVVINQWTIAHDPEFYDEPDRFNPNRYIREPHGLKDGVSQLGRKAVYSFGIGRRECPGKDLFFQNIKIALAQVIWAFDIQPAEAQLDVDVKTAYLPWIAMMPKPFKVRFVPRRNSVAIFEEKQKAELVISKFFE